MSSSSTAFRTANPHALACILEAAETRSIIAATDIFDASGIKLWARDRPVSAELQRKLADRRLLEPLETSLVAEDGVTTMQLHRAVEQLLDGRDDPLAPLLRPQAARVLRELDRLALHPAAQLLLTAAQSARPETFDHATRAMAVCATLAASAGGDTPEILAALLAGLLHDLGEIYLDPRHNESDVERDIDWISYQQLVVHPHIGFLILRQLTAYPHSVATAVAEHHERLDGSGYPRALQRQDISPLGRMLAVTEAALNAMRDPYASLLKASVALRVVPGEFDDDWAGRISRAATALQHVQAAMEPDDIRARLHALDAVLRQAQQAAGTLEQPGDSGGLRGAAQLADFLLGRLRIGWNESGLWAAEVTAGPLAAEVEAVEDELYRRLRSVQCAALMRAGKLEAGEDARLRGFCEALAMGAG